ncbi:hypothetical protein [Wolbachia endosymbiont of Tettigetta isshikii]|uniref:hypothetical protein n=1 Tax=Wolbachia endosymbiont of Tettigetta isshikii TaxID=3239093 RepID=UPI0039805B6D
MDIGKSVDELCKEVGKKVQNKLDEVSIKDLVDNINRLAETLEDRVARLKPGERMGLMGASFTDKRLTNAPRENGSLPQGEQASSDKEPDTQRVDWSEGVKEIGQLKKKIKALERALEEKESNQTKADSGISSETSSTASNGLHQSEKEMLEEENKNLKEQEYIEKLRKENAKLKESLSPEVKERKEKINSKPSEFLYYVLESIKLGEKATLRNFNNKIIIHWKDGSQTICHIKKQGDLPSTEVDFVDKNIQAAFEAACVW